VETVHILERQMFIENLHIPGQKDDSFDPNLRMTNTTTGLAGVSHRRQQCGSTRTLPLGGIKPKL